MRVTLRGAFPRFRDLCPNHGDKVEEVPLASLMLLECEGLALLVAYRGRAV